MHASHWCILLFVLKPQGDLKPLIIEVCQVFVYFLIRDLFNKYFNLYKLPVKDITYRCMCNTLALFLSVPNLSSVAREMHTWSLWAWDWIRLQPIRSELGKVSCNTDKRTGNRDWKFHNKHAWQCHIYIHCIAHPPSYNVSPDRNYYTDTCCHCQRVIYVSLHNRNNDSM